MKKRRWFEGYTISPHTYISGTVPDATTYYFYRHLFTAAQVDAGSPCYIGVPGILRRACIIWKSGTAISNEDISLYVTKNLSSDTLIATVGDTELIKVFRNNDMNIPFDENDTLIIKLVTPTWSTNASNAYLQGLLYIET